MYVIPTGLQIFANKEKKKLKTNSHIQNENFTVV